MKGQTGTHTAADLVTAVANELPMSTESAIAEVEHSAKLLSHVALIKIKS